MVGGGGVGPVGRPGKRAVPWGRVLVGAQLALDLALGAGLVGMARRAEAAEARVVRLEWQMRDVSGYVHELMRALMPRGR
jgi:hypothetical protein